jgi:glycosyltransferase involved in cell wall biosynthesis
MGVAAKIQAQADALRSLPGNVALLYPSGGEIHCNGEVVKRFGSGPLWRRLVHYAIFYPVAATWARQVDYVYLRYQGASPALVRMLRRIRRENPGAAVFVEIPTYPYDSAAVTPRARFLLAIDRAWRRKAFKLVDRIVTFSRDERIFGVPTVRTDNGVQVDTFQLLPPPPKGGPLRLVAVANVSYWHGYDRVVAGLARYRANGGAREVHFDIVGDGNDLHLLKTLVAREHLEDRVHFHGSLRGPALSAVLARCQVGVSCIGLHRKRSDTSDLKSREYCARGLPFVIGYEDRDFPPGFAFAYQAPADDSPIDIEAVAEFHENLLGSRADYRHEMRAYAERQLAWEVKMRPVLDALRNHALARSAA